LPALKDKVQTCIDGAVEVICDGFEEGNALIRGMPVLNPRKERELELYSGLALSHSKRLKESHAPMEVALGLTEGYIRLMLLEASANRPLLASQVPQQNGACDPQCRKQEGEVHV
jgi:hypothetical protein